MTPTRFHRLCEATRNELLETFAALQEGTITVKEAKVRRKKSDAKLRVIRGAVIGLKVRAKTKRTAVRLLSLQGQPSPCEAPANPVP